MASAAQTCLRCGNNSPAEAAFCAVCGQKLAPPAPSPRFARGGGRRSCTACGTPLSSFATTCPTCGQSVAPATPANAPVSPADFTPLPQSGLYQPPIPPPMPVAPVYAPHVQCPQCGHWVSPGVTTCPHCRAYVTPPAPLVYAVPPPAPYTGYGYPLVPYRPRKEKTTAALLALLLGGFGIQRFYLGQTLLGVLSVIFFWTYIPALIGFVEGIVLLCMDENEFQRRYNSPYP